MGYENEDLMTNLKATELRLGLPGQHETDDMFTNIIINNKKRQLSTPSETNIEKISKKSDNNIVSNNGDNNDKSHQQEETAAPPPPKAQIVGWPPVRAYRKNSLVSHTQKSNNTSSEAEIPGMFVKVSMDGAPYLRKIDIRVYQNYPQLLKALEALFKFTIGEYSEREGYKGSDYVPTYEDKDGDWMLVGDVPWDMFMSSCKRMRIMRESEARGLGCGV